MANAFDNVKKLLKKTAGIMGLSEENLNYLSTPKKVLKAKLKVGDKEYQAYRVQYNNVLGPTKGGIRYHPNVSLDEVKALGFWMTLKNSLAGLPYGGAKGGVIVNPKELTEEEIEELSREYVRAFHQDLGAWKDVPAPDVYTTPQIMAWMLDEFEKIKGEKEPAMITGKPLELGGSKGRSYSTAQGGVFVLMELLKERKNIKIAIQGFGNAGSNAAKILYEQGYKIIAVSDSKTGIYKNEGLNINEVIAYKRANKTLKGYENAKEISNKELLELETDVLILAALENQITIENADRIKAEIILELANGPVTPEADEILDNKNIIVVPDILANSGGVIVSYFEWVQNLQAYYWTEEEVIKKLKQVIVNSLNKVLSMSKEKNVSLRMAAYIAAIKRILDASKLRGEKID